jgi:hypothetical protein
VNYREEGAQTARTPRALLAGRERMPHAVRLEGPVQAQRQRNVEGVRRAERFLCGPRSRVPDEKPTGSASSPFLSRKGVGFRDESRYSVVISLTTLLIVEAVLCSLFGLYCGWLIWGRAGGGAS